MKDDGNDEDFEGSMVRLEEIVELMGSGELKIDEMVKLFEEGMEIARRCTEILDRTELKIISISKNRGGEMVDRDVTTEMCG